MTALSKAALKVQVDDDFPNNNEELITEPVMRSMLDNIIDSMHNTIDDGNPLTDGSGTEIVAGQINLGGVMTSSAFFTGQFVWDMFTDSGTNSSNYSQGVSQILLDVRSQGTGRNSTLTLLEFQTQWKHETSTQQRSIAFDETQAIFTQTGTASGGFKYAADYSLGFTDRSLIDKGFGDANYMSTGLSFVDILGEPTANTLLERDLFLDQGTSLTTGGILSANVVDTLLDISDGSGFIVDKTSDILNASVPLVWTGGLFTGVTVPNIGTQSFTNIAIEDTGGGVPGVVFSPTAFTRVQHRDFIVLGTIVHPSGTIIDQSHNPTTTQNLGTRMSDFFSSVGVVTREGNIYKPGTSGLLITKTAGQTFSEGGNVEFDRKLTDIIPSPEQVDLDFSYLESDGAGDFDLITPKITSIIPGFWDDLSGTLQVVSMNNWQNQREFFQPSSGNTLMMYGQAVYNSKAAALAGINTENFQPDATLEANRFAFRGWLVLRGGATDLDDLGDAEFRSAGKFNTTLASSGFSTKDEFSDNLFRWFNAADPDKLVGVDLSGLTSPSLRTWTIKDKSGIPALIEDVESKGTGVFNGGFITSPGAQTVSVTDGNGIIVDSFTDGEVPAEIPVSWTGITAVVVPTFTSRNQTWIFIDNAGLIVFDVNDVPAKTTFINNIFLGLILHDNSVPASELIKGTINNPHVANSIVSLVRDHISATGGVRIASGFDLTPGTVSTLELNTTSGIAFGQNVNWHTDRINPNFATLTGSTPITMDIVISDGTTHQSNVTLLDRI